MSNRVHIICHPDSGGGQGEIALKEVIAVLSGFQLEFIIYTTDYMTHAKTITEQIITRGGKPYQDYLLVIGGDGTLNEVVSTLYLAKRDIPIAYVPAGTGNSFHESFQPDKTTRQIIECMLFERNPKRIPIYTYNESVTRQKGIILNTLGFGFDAIINQKGRQVFNHSILKKFNLYSLAYFIAIFQKLNQMPHFDITVEADGQTFFIKNCSVASVVNPATVSGVIHLDKNYQAKEGELSLILYHDIDKQALTDILPRILWKHNLSQSPYTTRINAKSLSFKLLTPALGHVDGELLGEIEGQVSFGIVSYPFYI